MEKIYLRIVDFKYGEIKIPFLSIRELDLFTVRYKNQKEFIDVLSQLLELPITVDSVATIGVQCSKGDTSDVEIFPIKYIKDNYDMQSLQQSFTNYLLVDHNRIMNTPIVRIRTGAILGFINKENNLTEFDIKLAVNLYFESASYKKIRELYFKYKDKLNIKKNDIDFSQSIMVDKKLSKFNSDDDYVEYLLQYALKGEEECQEVIEELSLMDLEELNRKIHASHYGIFDGMDTENDKYIRDIGDLEKYSGFKLEELIEIVSISDKKSSRR